jgi:hypothetical protein
MFKNFIFLLLATSSLVAQSDKDSLSINPKYLEDQLYFGLTYNIFSNTPDQFVQDGFAYGFSGGFIKDIPFNKRRNIGLGIGIGYTFNTYIQNLVITENSAEQNFDAITYSDTYTIKTNSLEFPIEFRWRTSTLDTYKFWRIYTGINISYVLNSKAIGVSGDELVELTQVLELERFQYAYTLAAGYGTWNFYMNYSLVPFFKKNSVLGSESLKMNTFRLGLIFYFL